MSEKEIPNYPKETAKFLSWSSLKFIHAPSNRTLHWTVVGLVAVFFVALGLSFWIELDVGVEGTGEIAANTGTREAKTLISGFLTEVTKKVGDPVKESEIIGKLQLGATTEKEIQKAIDHFTEINRDLQNKTGKDEITFPSTLSISKIQSQVQNTEVIRQLAELEGAYGRLKSQYRVTQKDTQKELKPVYRKIASLKKKIKKIKKSNEGNLLQYYIENAEEELNELKAKVAITQSSARTDLEKRVIEFQSALLLAKGGLEKFLSDRVVRSPVAGRVAKVHVGANSNVDANRTIATIIPHHSNYIAKIKVRSKNIVKISESNEVQYRVEAYPYQKFGLFSGKILSFDHIKESESLASDEFTLEGSIQPPSVSYSNPSEFKLVLGMKFNCTIISERKKIIDIVTEKFFGKLN